MKPFSSINTPEFSKKEFKRFQQFCLILLISGSLAGCAGYANPSDNAISYNKEKNNQLESVVRKNQHYSDLWQEVRANMGNEVNQNNPRIDYYVRWFSKHPIYFEKLMARAQPYLYYIMQEVNKRHMPSEFALVPVVESAFDPFAYSNGLAAGLWQITPSTGKYYEVKQDWWFDGRRDVVTATDFALNYFQQLHKEFNSWELALAAYNAGNGTVGKAIRNNLNRKQSISYWDLHLPRQTENYVPKLLAVAKIIQNPSAYHIKLKPIPNRPFFTSVNVGSQIDLKRASELSGISLKELRQLNPGYNRWATDPSGPYKLLIPVANTAHFKKNLENLPQSERISWQRYTAHSKDTLDTIAKTFNTSAAVIKKVNHLENNTIYVGEPLLIPQPVDDRTVMSHAQKALALAQAKNIISDKQGRIRHTYTIKSGDTLSLIAIQHNLALKQVLTWNHLTNRSTIHPGQKLLLWIGQDNLIRSAYSVKSGDSLWSIAKHFHTSIDQLLEWNNLGSDATLRPKQKLTVWRKPSDTTFKTQLTHSSSVIRKVYYTVRKGESINNIANKFRVGTGQITHWNTLKHTQVKPGQKLTLFVDVTRVE